jgi:hypothetical protein
MRARGASGAFCGVCPRYTTSFGMFEHAYPLLYGERALMPPQGLLVVAAALPASWEVRLVDENIRPATRDDYLWVDAVFVTGIHAQRRQIEAICRRACCAAECTGRAHDSGSARPRRPLARAGQRTTRCAIRCCMNRRGGRCDQ